MSKFTNAIKGMSKLKKVMVGMWLGVAATLIALVAVLIAFGSHVGDKKATGADQFKISQNVEGLAAGSSFTGKVNLKDPKDGDVLSDFAKNSKNDVYVDLAAAKAAKPTGTFFTIDRAGLTISQYASLTADPVVFKLTGDDSAFVFTQDAKNKSNAVAAIGTVFALTLVGAIGVTVAESIYRKRGAK